MSIDIKHKGALHKDMHVKKGSKIPLSKERAALARAKRNHDVKEEKRLVFALNARHFNHKKHTG